MDLDFVSVHKLAKKELGQYPAILTSHLVNNPYCITQSIVIKNITGEVISSFNIIAVDRPQQSLVSSAKLPES